MTEQPEPVPHEAPAQTKSGFWETVRFIVVSLLIVIVIRTYIAQPFIVSGESMEPTFLNGEYLVVDELTYRFEKPSRGDVIIMRYPLDTRKYFIKRIIGLPGETVVIDGQTVTVTPADGGTPVILFEPYVANAANDRLTRTLYEGEYFVLGDNRTASSDSRRWGPLPANDIIGRPILRLLPVSRLSLFPGGTKGYEAADTQP